ncbi:MAG: hypothetical protein H6907_00730 [Hyphomicrobiales bacterium]|nr:hypothetical protein [Hyphomicrobiales bacterium]
MRLPLAAAALLLAAGTSQADCALPGGADDTAAAGGLEVAYRFEPAPRVGRPFAMVLAVCGPGTELAAVDAVMPAHRHGMNYRPTVAETGPGAYRAEGFLLHMPGPGSSASTCAPGRGRRGCGRPST